MSEAPIIRVAAFYKFTPLSSHELATRAAALTELAERHEVRGLIILAEEGVNGTIAGPAGGVGEVLSYVNEALNAEVPVKESRAHKNPFRRFKVDIRPEIVTLGDPSVKPSGSSHRHLSPEEWHRRVERGDAIVLDTRNRYETRVGKFRGAVDPNIGTFSEFSKFVQEWSIPKEKEVLMYCTGGIRCEKAILEMERQGFGNVYQLEGGILAYLEKFPEGQYEGECFVFDHRVAVDAHLRPSSVFGLCPHCGDPAPVEIACGNCGAEKRICERCAAKPSTRSCSKNCEYHLALRLASA